MTASLPVSPVSLATTSHVTVLSPVTFALPAPGLPVAGQLVFKTVLVSDVAVGLQCVCECVCE